MNNIMNEEDNYNYKTLLVYRSLLNTFPMILWPGPGYNELIVML
jgi:hypothetical protein